MNLKYFYTFCVERLLLLYVPPNKKKDKLKRKKKKKRYTHTKDNYKINKKLLIYLCKMFIWHIYIYIKIK